jgi:hypothetical protein
MIGGIIYLIVGIIVAAAAAFIGSIVGVAGYGVGGLAIASVGAIGLVSGILMVVGAVMMNSSNKSKVRTGSVLVLLFTLIGAIFTLGGFLIGFILGLIGSIMGLVWKPSGVMPPPPPPPM